jgi:hypothetical protein
MIVVRRLDIEERVEENDVVGLTRQLLGKLFERRLGLEIDGPLKSLLHNLPHR